MSQGVKAHTNLRVETWRRRVCSPQYGAGPYDDYELVIAKPAEFCFQCPMFLRLRAGPILQERLVLCASLAAALGWEQHRGPHMDRNVTAQDKLRMRSRRAV